MKRNNKPGFTFIETIVYLAIVAILLVAVISFHLIMANTSAKLSRYIDTSYNRRVALSSIDYLLRNSSGLLRDVDGDCSHFDSNPPVLALYFTDDNYLPGTCVGSGGGVKITLDNYRLKMTCYPNITNNGEHQTCNASSTYSYFLTSPAVRILNGSLSFSTSTATSTASGFMTVTTKLAVGVNSSNQANLAATSTATSTAVLRNQSPLGLVSLWKFDDQTVTAAIDSVDSNTLNCAYIQPTAVSGLVDGSTGAYYFNLVESDFCFLNDPSNLNPSNAFTVATWIKAVSCGCSTDSIIMSKYSVDNKKGYRLYVDRNSSIQPYDLVFEVCDSNACTELTRAADIINDDTVYHVSAIYDLDNDIAKMYVYQKGVNGVSTTTANSLPTLVNNGGAFMPMVGASLGATLDELRFYNRALSDEEIWALQTQGEY